MKATLARLLAVLVALTMVVPVSALSGPNEPAASGVPEIYIVELKDAALPVYKGSITGLQATSIQATGDTKLNVNTAASVQYINYLKTKQSEFLTNATEAIGRQPEVVYQYQLAMNGMAVRLTAAEAAALAKLDGVAAVIPDWVEYAQTDVGPTWIGAGEVWDGTAADVATKGEGMIVGIVDTGINMDHPSFAATGPVDGYVHTNPRGKFYGWCDPTNVAVYTTTVTCNDKLIGVWSFDTDLPEDYNGHGTHVASTAAGNVLTAVVQAPTTVVTRSISGVAPHANIIAYSIEGTPGAGSAPGSSIVAAFEQVIADGVDVVNYSFGGTSVASPWSTENLLYAQVRLAGVFMATSAGNTGPTVGSVSNKPAPWYMAVANSTHNRQLENDLINMEGGSNPPADMKGVAFSAGYGPAPIIYAGWYSSVFTQSQVIDGVTYTPAQLASMCLVPFPAGTFAGQIVVCDRGVNARVDKGANIKAGGAGGHVLVNTSASQSLNGDAHYLPTVHLAYANTLVLRGWLTNTVVQTATISGFSVNLDALNGDVMSASSSRGPSLASPTLLKPDIAAPGTDILAAVADGTTAPDGQAEFDFYSGTSMASPHVAGAAALVMKLHPDWTPAEVQSALMTTALSNETRPVKENGTTLADPFDVGAGRVDVAKAAQAGFVLDESVVTMWNANPAWGGDPTALNLASLANPSCVEECEWTRTISSTMDSTVTWTVQAMAQGFTLTVEPASFALAPGATQQIKITADVSQATLNAWRFGKIVFTPDSEDTVVAHFPAAVKRAVSNIPTQVRINTNEQQGTDVLTNLKAIEIVTLTTGVHGLAQAVLSEAYIVEDPTPDDPTDVANGGVHYYTTTVSATDMRLVVEIVKTTSPDLDLFVYNRNGQRVCASATSATLEYCSISGSSLITGTYHIFIQNYESGQSTITLPDRVVYATAVVPVADQGNFEVTGPTAVAAGDPFTLTMKWDITGYQTSMFSVKSYWYGAFDTGSQPTTPGNLGRTFVDLVYTPITHIYLPLVMRAYPAP